MAHVAVSSLLRTIELEFFQSQPRPLPQQQKQIITDCTDVIESLCESLRFVQSSLEELQGLDGEGREKLPRDLGAKLRDFGLKAEDGIESELSHIYLAGELVPSSEEPQPPSPATLRQVLQRAVDEIDRIIKEDLTSIKDSRRNKLEQAEDVAAQSLASDEPPEEIMVGKSDELDEMKDRLRSNNSLLQVVAVHGMGGIGKTVLAKSIYEDKSIKKDFDIRAWVVISQHHNKDQMLSRLLKSLGQEQSHSDSIEEQIYKHLKGKRYLIVMDDVWSIDAWNGVRGCFPDDSIGSRVLLTTRLKNVAQAAATTVNPKNCYGMRFFNPEESWDLFKEKEFLVEISNQVEFETIGKKVVEKCYGLPLAVAVAAGLFSKLATLEEWKNVEKAIDSLERKPIAESCADILALSYNHLPHYLKSCFLYFGFFPKNYPLIAKKLVRLWIVEGFVKEGENERVVGEKHLHELIDRSLVLVGDRKSSYGTIRTCMVHDLLHDLSIREAQNEKLLYVVGDREMGSSSQRWITARKESYSDPSVYACFRNCRSFLYFEEDKEAIKLMKHGIFKQTLGSRKHISDLLQVSSNLKLLRVLEMSSFECLHELGSLSNWIADLVHLRHLSLIIGLPLTNFPISKARNLHTIRISAGYQGMEDPFPPFILDELPQLRYLKCWPSCQLFPPTFVHENLHSVSSISPVQCLQQVFAKIPHLRKLSITGERFYFILYGENLASLRQLESLSIDFQGFSASQTNHTPTSSVDNIASLHGLKKLKLMCTEILWKDVNLLAKLPKLEVLKLIFQACVGTEWKLVDEEEEYAFCSLKHLFIDYSSLVEWEATDVNFPVLERLLLSRCSNLKEIPRDFVDIATLQLIVIIGCPPSVEDSARVIEEGQRDSGNDTIEVVIHKMPSNSDAETSDPNGEGPSREEEDS
ncbi:PREDICTED: putative disease resistance RPP13-like protein 3 [Ipomoea nil]|uniref:putative disease resistance RPP13-like protein 3 n=1 Tax=Ipomoea nil TaxID=35883 RepID=UPI00090146B5|nr:PREDICTED: putative disease resistance RPP13-like protein 3 [Ipomoea nil]XP_019181846.1 PREDICTED: putative disease resistance RPP13-like protein 3 [Ipomoea nil]XP_019181847.1 PREDICTED: putative disease resistance RPP13-like protein 3 [Ipomoea nil]XP_019181848.1 PREDICTED: putative disease resistance RPP13-like protein 3 [Ipomoea nil]XP_019181849.1 PREDICTED: putative disease resistance RPP13-like protein 3 [Ipomoea nil]XP_019181850.1 PREDICTED: putative disease resistance RPP13-like prote